MSGEKPRRGDLVAVTGATGFVGQAVLMAAGRHQLDVRALTRRKQRLRGGVEWVDGDLADVPALKRLMDGASAVIHIAGVVNAPDAAGFEEGNVQGTLRVIEAAHEMGVSRLIHVSSLAAREPQLSMYGASKLRGEKLVRASGLDWSVVRPPAVFGPRDTEMLELFRLARRGVIPLPPPGHLSIIHVADLAELLLALLPSGEDVTRKVFEPDDGEPGGWTHVALARAIGAAVHEPLWKVAGSQFLLTDDGAIERTASRGLRDGCFVNASGHPDPEGAFIELAVPSFNDIRLRTITLPRRAVERSPAESASAAIGAAVREKPVRPLSLSPGIVRLAARADRLLRGKKAKLTPDRARYICHPDWTVSEEARPPASLWRPRIDTREGLQATAAWYREAGWLK